MRTFLTWTAKQSYFFCERERLWRYSNERSGAIAEQRRGKTAGVFLYCGFLRNSCHFLSRFLDSSLLIPSTLSFLSFLNSSAPVTLHPFDPYSPFSLPFSLSSLSFSVLVSLPFNIFVRILLKRFSPAFEG